MPHCQENLRKGRIVSLYSKPTQVGEENILRRLSQPALRNSANLPRNFGRRGDILGEQLRAAELDLFTVNGPERLFNKNTGLC